MNWQIDTVAMQQVKHVVNCGYPLVFVETWEEERLEKILTSREGNGEQLPIWTWSASDGFTSGPGANEDLKDPLLALEFVKRHGGEAVSLMRDLPSFFFENQQIKRALRDIYDQLMDTPGFLVMTHPCMPVPEDLRKEVNFLKLPVPDRGELESYLRMLNQALPEGGQFGAEWLANCAAEMKSFTTNEAKLLFKQLCREQANDLGKARTIIREQRAQYLMKESCLEVVNTSLDLNSIGGLENLKKWITSRHELFGLDAQREGIAPPSGILMMGVSGCGKSLAAKVIASAWNLLLIRLDMNLIMSGAWGSPEIAWARALNNIETVAPVVVWIDEIENSFGYVNGHAASGNLTIFSSFLTWMQEKAQDVFVVATANNIDLLPAEMLRKGRFDELFFLDLPKAEARAEILGIHIKRQGGDPDSFALEQLAELLEGWTAAEIEQLVRAARLEAFYGKRKFTFADLKSTCFKMVPLSKTMSEQINELRRWARSRAVSAD